MEEADRGVVCDDCGRFIREGPPTESDVFPGLKLYIRSLCEECLPHHECPEFDRRREEQRERDRGLFRKLEHPGQQELDL